MTKIKKFNDHIINEANEISTDDKFRVNGSELFHWNSSLSFERKLEILNWYEGLDKDTKDKIDILRSENYSEGYECGANDPDL